MIIDLFAGKAVMQSRAKDFMILYTHSGDKTNAYHLQMANKQFRFNRDSIEYTPDQLQIKYKRGSELYQREVIENARMLLSRMDSLGIHEFSSDWGGPDIKLKINMLPRGVLLYVPHPQSVTEKVFIDYIHSMQKLDENWYYSMNE